MTNELVDLRQKNANRKENKNKQKKNEMRNERGKKY